MRLRSRYRTCDKPYVSGSADIRGDLCLDCPESVVERYDHHGDKHAGNSR
ncbi:hypothetical protein [Actinomadura sp. 6N118]